jgi:long-chain acyl-CoA synthetase
VALLVASDEVDRVARDADGVRALLAGVVADVNRDLGHEEQVRRFAVLPRPFRAEEGEVTPTLKLRRRVCAERFRDEIERLYQGAAAAEAPGA